MKEPTILIKTNVAHYHLPLRFVAEHRARHYDDSPFQDEVSFVMEDEPFEGLDWLNNNMDWADFKDALVKVEREIEEDCWNYESEIIK